MTDNQKTTQEEPRSPYSGMSFAAMMEKMMGQHGCGCMETMSQITDTQGIDCDYADMMAMCCGAQNEEETTTETTQEA
ncbi:MAG: hypothetical protein JSU74_04275 [Candidatus Zixiibacteriota bacterium]|nr:MAG: hypothetical protein JSU74_04275 [candidate division Zixibacteria bacterium]